LLDKKLAGGEEHQRVALINDQIMYINHLIDAMLTMSQLDSRVDISFRRFDLNEILREVLSVGRPLAENKGQQIVARLNEDQLIIAGAKDDLYLALYHLMDNAISFTGENGTITVTSSREGNMALMTITDTGIGISEADLPRIFERFFRADQARTERRVGLGLSMCKKIITMHAGRIEVESVPDKGSRFSVWLPVFDM
jgi:signal transduction histidine kinase